MDGRYAFLVVLVILLVVGPAWVAVRGQIRRNQEACDSILADIQHDLVSLWESLDSESAKVRALAKKADNERATTKDANTLGFISESLAKYSSQTEQIYRLRKMLAPLILKWSTDQVAARQGS